MPGSSPVSDAQKERILYTPTPALGLRQGAGYKLPQTDLELRSSSHPKSLLILRGHLVVEGVGLSLVHLCASLKSLPFYTKALSMEDKDPNSVTLILPRLY